MGSRNGRNGLSGTHPKLDRHNLEDFTPQPEEDEARADETPAGATEQSDTDAGSLSAARSRAVDKSQTTAIVDHSDEILKAKQERRSAADAYQPLGDFLENFSADTVMITFPALENMLKRKLPPSARERETWWTNRPRGRGHAMAWRDAGWSVERVDLNKGRVTFTRHTP